MGGILCFLRMKLLEEENNNFAVHMCRLKSETVKLDEVKEPVLCFLYIVASLQS